ncbi:hypothetical protein NtRootA9_28900 [Arthrobacter sp. NtRootA9]|nr:hypothetical protein NtRootA9_28900 [Arthrobacter sp. NtRootA9]
MKTLNMNGFAFEIRGMIRYPSDLTAGRITAVGNSNAAAPVTIRQRDITPKAANTWEPFRVPFVMPKDTATLKLELRRLPTSGTTVDYDDVHAYAV